MTVMPHSSVRQTNHMKRELKFHVLSVQCDNILLDKNDFFFFLNEEFQFSNLIGLCKPQRIFCSVAQNLQFYYSHLVNQAFISH